MTSEGVSPSVMHAPLEYITIDSYEWPKETPRPKRRRLETEAQKQRHRADQKRFVQRKRARLAILREQGKLIELQYQYLKAVQEENELRVEQQRLEALQQVQIDACISETCLSCPAIPASLDTLEPTDLDSLLVDLLFSL